MQRFCVILIFLMAQLAAPGQRLVGESSVLDFKLYVDTLSYSWEDNWFDYRDKPTLPFKYDDNTEIVEGYLYFDVNHTIESVTMLPSSDYFLLDSLVIINDYARFRVRFKDLTSTGFLRLTFRIRERSGTTEYVEIPLFPFTETYAAFYPTDTELFVGESKTIELVTNHADNLIIDERWTEGLPINYRLRKEADHVQIQLEPTALGTQRVSIPLKLKKPMIKGGKVVYDLPEVTALFSVKGGRLSFLQIEQQEVTPYDDRTQPIEIQIQNDRNLRLGRTYRLENQEENGGALVAELYTKTYLNNDKVLCLIRPYAYHRKSEGYLYIKYGDQPQYVTNVDITPKTEIRKILIQRDGQDWNEGNTVLPGETITLKLEGVSFHKARFSFPGVQNLMLDSLVRNEKTAVFKIKIPSDIITSKIEIYDQAENTGWSLQIKEYQVPREFDFISLELDDQVYPLDQVDKPIYYDESLTDLLISFDRSKIDEGQHFYGKQYLSVKIKVSNKAGNLIELYQFDELVICPNESSLRSAHYNDPNCLGNGLNLNNYLSKKTSSLEEWSKIDIEVSHIRDKYSTSTSTRKIQIYLRREYNFDLDVSFPGGLLILKPGEGDFTNFSGISFAMIAQFSFYQPGKIAKYQPYKVGAGFIAIDAFNFTESNNGDVGLVVIGSLYPIAENKKLTLPLYAGFGYLMKENKPFFLIGPGIQVRL